MVRLSLCLCWRVGFAKVFVRSAHLLSSDTKGASALLPLSTSGLVNSRTLMGCTDPPIYIPHVEYIYISLRGSAHPIDDFSGVGSKLPLPLFADVRDGTIPMTHNNDVGHSGARSCFQSQ